MKRIATVVIISALNGCGTPGPAMIGIGPYAKCDGLSGSAFLSCYETVRASPELAATQIKITDGPLDPEAVIETGADKTMMRVFINKRTGGIRFQIYHSETYTDTGWHFYESASYESPTGLGTSDLTMIAQEVHYCSPYGFSRRCVYNETFGFLVSEDVLRWAVKRGKPWQFKIFGRADSFEDEVIPGKIAAILSAVDKYQSRIPAS